MGVTFGNKLTSSFYLKVIAFGAIPLVLSFIGALLWLATHYCKLLCRKNENGLKRTMTK